MKIAADTNLLVRILTNDDPKQSAIARTAFEQAELVVISTVALCELVWVLSRGYRLPPTRIAEAIRRMIDVENVAADWGMVDAGIAQLDAGGDFADGVIVYDARKMGATVFVSFDRKAVRLLESRGEAARLL